MKIKFFYCIIIIISLSCSSAIDKVNSINSKSNLASDRFVFNSKISENEFNERFIDSVKNILIQNKTINIPYEFNDIVEQISFSNFNDTIYLADLNVKTISGGMPLEFEYDVKPNDNFYFNIENIGRNKLDKLQITENQMSRFVFDNLSKRDFVSSSIKILSGNKIKVSLTNDGFLKNLGFLKSKIRLSLKKTTNVYLQREVFYDSSIVSPKKIIETSLDTVFIFFSNSNLKIGSKINFNESSSLKIPISIESSENLIAWTYWLSLNPIDSLSINDSFNPLIDFTKSELKNNIDKNFNFNLLKSENKDIDLFFENHTLDRRSLNFDKNFALYKVDNSFTNLLSKKGYITVTNKSNLYDYSIQFIVLSTHINETKVEVIKDIVDPKKYIKLTLIGL